jgi:TonB family protein
MANRPEQDEQPRDIQFAHFGVLNPGKQGRGSIFTAIALNVAALLVIMILGATAKKIAQKQMLSRLDAPIPQELKKEAPKPKPVIKELPKPPKIKVEPPKIDMPKIEVPEPPKIQTPVMKAAPIPVLTPAPPKAVNPPPAPKVVSIHAQAAAVANNNPTPAPIRVGSMTNPIHDTTGPAVSPINLGRAGAPGMPSANTGLGPASKINLGGSGSPGGRLGGTDNAARPVVGVKLGTPGGTGPVTSRPVGAIQIASTQPQQVRPIAQPSSGATKAPPKLLFKPKPEYTAEARQMHLEGTVYVKIHVTAAGSVQVVGVTSGLGHGLDQEAVRAVQGMRFQPAMQDGHPIDWDGVVNINFQMAG